MHSFWHDTSLTQVFQNCIQIPWEAELWQKADGVQAVTMFSYISVFAQSATSVQTNCWMDCQEISYKYVSCLLILSLWESPDFSYREVDVGRFEWNVSIKIWWITIKFGTHIHSCRPSCGVVQLIPAKVKNHFRIQVTRSPSSLTHATPFHQMSWKSGQKFFL